MAHARVMVAEAAARPTPDMWPTLTDSPPVMFANLCRINTIKTKVARWCATLTAATYIQVVSRPMTCKCADMSSKMEGRVRDGQVNAT